MPIIISANLYESDIFLLYFAKSSIIFSYGFCGIYILAITSIGFSGFLILNYEASDIWKIYIPLPIVVIGLSFVSIFYSYST